MDISLVVLICVFILIAVRKIGHFNIKIWQSMTGGALIVVATQQISFFDAVKAIDRAIVKSGVQRFKRRPVFDPQFV
jgi:hypothetical protein